MQYMHEMYSALAITLLSSATPLPLLPHRTASPDHEQGRRCVHEEEEAKLLQSVV